MDRPQLRAQDLMYRGLGLTSVQCMFRKECHTRRSKEEGKESQEGLDTNRRSEELVAPHKEVEVTRG